MFPSFTAFGKTVAMYGVCAVVGVFVCFIYLYFITKKKGTEFEDLILLFVSVAIGLFLVGHILYFITNIPALIKALPTLTELDFKGLLKVILHLFSGSVFYGGFIGGAVGVIVYSKIFESNIKYNLDIYAVAVPLFHFFGRIGCFFGGCCYGIECKFGFTVTNNIYNPDINGVSRLPIQLIEAVFNLIIFAVIAYLFKKEKYNGKLIYIYMILYSAVRFTDEFFRGDAIRGIFFGLSTSQWISIVLFVISAFTLIKSYKTKEVV